MRPARGLCLLASLLWLVPAWAQLTLPGILRQPPPAKCDWTRDALGARAAFVGKQEFAVDAREPVQIWLVRAGNRIAISGTGTGAGAQVYVDVTAKIAETSDTFSDVCKHRRVGELSNAGTLLANAPIGSTDVLWRVEARAGGTRGYKGQRPFTLTILDVSSVREESAWKRGVPLHGMLCLDGIPEMDIERPASHQFSGRIRLEVNAEQSTVRLTPEQQAALSNSVLNSVALWVRACIGCRVEHLIVVLIDGRVYTRASANAWLESAMKNPTSGGTVALDPQQEKALKQVLQPVQMLIAGDRMNSASTGKELEKYELLPEASKRFLCSLKTSPANQRTVDALRRAACGEHMARGELSRIRVRFRAGPTACGDDQNVIACRSDLELTEYNARDFRFVAPGTSPVIIGTGSLGVDLQHVIAHEMGHWIGLSHIEKGQSLMSSSMESSRCIDTQTVNRLLAQSDGTGEAKLPQAFTMKRRRGPPQ